MNLSKSGVSVTAGIPGFSVNMGRSGAFLNTGIPGTGLYDRQRIGGRVGDRACGDTRATGPDDALDVILDGTGRPVVVDHRGHPVLDESILWHVHRSREYKERVRELSRAAHQSFREETEALVEIHTMTPPIRQEAEWRKALDTLEPERYQARAFPHAPPEEETIRTELAREARDSIRTVFFWRLPGRRRAYVEEHLQPRLNRARQEWEARRNQFERDEVVRRREWDGQARERYEKMRDDLAAALAGDPAYVERFLQERFHDMELPVEFSLDLEYDPDRRDLRLDIDLPELEDLPTQKASILKSGRVSIKKKSRRELRDQYARCVAGLLFFFSGEGFNASPVIATVTASGYTQRVNTRTGHEEDQHVISVRFEREAFSALNMDRLDPVEAVRGFPHRMDRKRSGELAAVEPL